MHFRLAAIIVGLGACAVASAVAQVPAPQRTQVMSDLAACRQVVSDSERLACYDRLVGVFDAAEAAGEVVVVERSQVAEARRALFGFSMNALPLFGRSDQAEPVEAIETTLVRAASGGSGKWLFVLDNGSVWAQTDSNVLPRTPRPGAEIRIRQGAVGSYLLSVNGARSVRVRRQE